VALQPERNTAKRPPENDRVPDGADGADDCWASLRCGQAPGTEEASVWRGREEEKRREKRVAAERKEMGLGFTERSRGIL
jgi:hypothetical protein